jgi:hypothetical protein
VEFIGMHGSTPNGFRTAEQAIDYALNGTGTYVLGGSNTAYALPGIACFPITGLDSEPTITTSRKRAHPQ